MVMAVTSGRTTVQNGAPDLLEQSRLAFSHPGEGGGDLELLEPDGKRVHEASGKMHGYGHIRSVLVMANERDFGPGPIWSPANGHLRVNLMNAQGNRGHDIRFDFLGAFHLGFLSLF
jgi:hypothetical protein